MRLGLAIVVVACAVVVGHLSPSSFFDRTTLMEHLCSWGSVAFVGFILLHVVLTAVGIPGTVMTVIGGTVFGLVWGTVLSVVGATLGAIVAFWIARCLFRDWAESQFGSHKILHRFDRAVRQHPWSFVFTVRFVPISPFNLVNFLFGLTSVGWVPYSVATFVGIVPGTLAYTWLGVVGLEAISGGDRLPLMLALGSIALLSALPAILTKKAR
ncbi:MAG: TVP38/TMEM64 family protein [Cyanobacteriota bacterium]|nr:TVP38/TMEM64 family protein [Cyanobacteriota bacterium]